MALEHHLDLVLDLERPEQRGVGLHAERGLRDDGAAAQLAAVAADEVELDRLGVPDDRQVARARSVSPSASTRVERKLMSWR